VLAYYILKMSLWRTTHGNFGELGINPLAWVRTRHPLNAMIDTRAL